MSAHIFIFAEDGHVGDVLDEKGNPLSANIHIIDFDNAVNGSCPVCQEELLYAPDDDDRTHEVCACGYHEDLDNAFECARKLAFAPEEESPHD